MLVQTRDHCPERTQLHSIVEISNLLVDSWQINSIISVSNLRTLASWWNRGRLSSGAAQIWSPEILSGLGFVCKLGCGGGKCPKDVIPQCNVWRNYEFRVFQILPPRFMTTSSIHSGFSSWPGNEGRGKGQNKLNKNKMLTLSLKCIQINHGQWKYIFTPA